MTTMMEAHALGAALEAADAHGLLQRLAERPHTAGELASKLDLDLGACERVLEVLRTNDLLSRDGDTYGVSASVRAELLGPGTAPGESKWFWSHVGAYLETGHTIVPTGRADERAPVYAEATPLLAAMFEPLAASLAASLAPRLTVRPHPRILDVGAGSGVWSLAILSRCPSATVVALDLAPVLPRFLERADANGLHARVEIVAADYHDDATVPDAAFDLVLLANVVHLEPPARAEALVRRFARAIAPGGALVIVDTLATDSPADARAHAAYALHLALRLPGARPYTLHALRELLARAGLSAGDPIPLFGHIRIAGALVAEPCGDP